MVEILILAGIIIGIRALYLWATKDKEEAKEFADKSSDEVRKTMGWVGFIALIGFVLFVLLIAAVAS